MRVHAGNIPIIKYQTWCRKVVKESTCIKHHIKQLLEGKKDYSPSDSADDTDQ